VDSREMVAMLSYLKWINGFAPKNESFLERKTWRFRFREEQQILRKAKNFLDYIVSAAMEQTAKVFYTQVIAITSIRPVGRKSIPAGSSMHRVIKQAQWLKANMPFDKAIWNKPFLSDEEALDIAAFVNDDLIHPRPKVANFDYPHPEEKIH
jgi:thiosulfate dehydrogenase